MYAVIAQYLREKLVFSLKNVSKENRRTIQKIYVQ